MKRLRIGTKILLVVAVFSAITLLAGGFAAVRMKALDNAYSLLMSGPGTEAVYLPRANRVLAQTRGDLYGLIAETDLDILASLRKVFDADNENFHKFLDQAIAAVPDDKA